MELNFYQLFASYIEPSSNRTFGRKTRGKGPYHETLTGISGFSLFTSDFLFIHLKLGHESCDDTTED